MPFICRDCDNKHRFRRNAWGHASWNTTEYVDEDGDVNDDTGYDYDNHDRDDWDCLECMECDGGDVDDVDIDEWEEWNGPDDEDDEDDLPLDKPGEDESWKEFIQRKQRM